MDVRLLQLALAPALVAAATLAGRRWGTATGGWIVGLPLTSGPVSVVLALREGPSFARESAIATVQGLTSVGAFVAAYAWWVRRLEWLAASALGLVAFAAATTLLRFVPLSLPIASAATALALVTMLRLLDRGAPAVAPVPPPPWDLVARMFTTTTMTVVLTESASSLGPRWSGLLSPFPVFTSVMVAFAHRLGGPGAAVEVLRGVVRGLFAFEAFFVVVAVRVESAGVLETYVVASAAAVLVAGALALGGPSRRVR